MEVLAIIPARGGSKGLPGKNIRPLNGHPLLAYSILAAQQSELITRIIVNTDDLDIAAIAQQYGAEIPFLRPANLALDNTTDFEVFSHQLKWHLENEQYRPDIIVQLRPTSPIRMPGWIDEGIRAVVERNADSLRIITEAPNTPYKMWTLGADKHAPMEPLLSIENIAEPFNMPRQQLPKVYWQVGTLDVIATSTIEAGGMSGKKILPMIIDASLSVDIDDLASFEKAEKIIAAQPCIKFHG